MIRKSMHKRLFCQKLFDSALGNSIHTKRKNCLVRFVSDLLDYSSTLSITEIGKKLTSKATVKSKIYASSCFMSNHKLEQNIAVIYRGLAHFFWSKAKEIVILIDWTGACSKGYHALEASVVGHGRSIPIYHEIHPESEQENALVHQVFLTRLKEIIPSHLSVTVITDAGFHRNWFEQVILQGWEVIGRVYSRYSYQNAGESQWRKVTDIAFGGVGKASALGKVKLGKTKKALEGYLYSYKEKLSGRVRKKKNRYPSHDKAHSDGYKNGWVIFSSLNKSGDYLIQYYKKRMQIEQNFKDIKNERTGVGLRRNLSSGQTRCNLLFFLACLLSIIFWWFGLMIETQNKHRSYQANTIKNKRVRSFIHLGRMAIRHEPGLLNWKDFRKYIAALQQQYTSFIECGVLVCG